MLRKTFVTLFTVTALCLTSATAARATTIAISNSDSGWYDDTGFHDPTNANYVAGQYVLGNDTFTQNDFFTFDLSSLAGQNVVSAKLQLFAYDISSDGNYRTFNVTTPIASLTAGGSGLVGTYADLGSGPLYGQTGVTMAQSNTLITFDLNAAAVAAINAGVGGMFAIGGSYIGNGSTDDYVFGFSDFDLRNQLIVETDKAVPDGGVTVSLLGGALMALGALRRKLNR